MPRASGFFLNSLWHLVALATVPMFVVLAGVAWRVKPRAGITTLLLGVALAAGWGIAYRWAMQLPVKALEHEFDSDR